METILPFAGFYNSLHDSQLDDVLEQIFSDDSGNCADDLCAKARDGVEWRACFLGYAQLYVKAFAKETGIDGLTFKELESPRFYNYGTDRIVCTITPEAAARLFANVDQARLSEVAKDRHTSRSGFCSFYSPDWQTWGDVATWDCNQLHTLILASLDSDFDQWAEFELMESASCNGDLDSLIWGNMSDSAIALANSIRH